MWKIHWVCFCGLSNVLKLHEFVHVQNLRKYHGPLRIWIHQKKFNLPVKKKSSTFPVRPNAVQGYAGAGVTSVQRRRACADTESDSDTEDYGPQDNNAGAVVTSRAAADVRAEDAINTSPRAAAVGRAKDAINTSPSAAAVEGLSLLSRGATRVKSELASQDTTTDSSASGPVRESLKHRCGNALMKSASLWPSIYTPSQKVAQ